MKKRAILMFEKGQFRVLREGEANLIDIIDFLKIVNESNPNEWELYYLGIRAKGMPSAEWVCEGVIKGAFTFQKVLKYTEVL